MEMKDFKQMNSIELAFLGDAVYEQFVRERLVLQGFAGGHADRLHKAAVRYVKAGAQAEIVKAMMKASAQDASADPADAFAWPMLSVDEQNVVTRARNHRIATKAKNATAADYKWATGFEALIGYLKLSGQDARLLEVLEAAAAFVESKAQPPA